MTELAPGFQYQRVLLLVQEQHQISVALLQTLVGGWLGAVVYPVGAARNETRRVEHCILQVLTFAVEEE